MGSSKDTRSQKKLTFRGFPQEGKTMSLKPKKPVSNPNCDSLTICDNKPITKLLLVTVSSCVNEYNTFIVEIL